MDRVNYELIAILSCISMVILVRDILILLYKLWRFPDITVVDRLGLVRPISEYNYSYGTAGILAPRNRSNAIREKVI